MILPGLLGTDPAAAGTDALRALAAAGWPDGGEPRPAVLVATPPARTNPFAGLLYRDLPDVRVLPVAVPDPVAAAALATRLHELTAGTVGCVVHLHWLHRVTATARDAPAARAAVQEVTAALTTARAAGARVLWTVHNRAPHRPRFPDAELALRRAAADLADVVHVMNPRTPELVAATSPLDPAKVRCVPHPSYAGAYPDTVTRARARQLLGIPAGAVVFAALGRLQPYKGLTALADAFQTLAATAPGRYRLVVAGAVDGVGPGPVRARPGPADPETTALLHRLARSRDIVCLPLAVPDDQVQVVLRAADVAVVPNLDPLNSGAELLAMTFGVPVVTTGDVPADAGWGMWAPPGDAPALAGVLRAAVDRLAGPGAGAARAAALARAEAVAPSVVGPVFARLVRELLDHPNPAGPGAADPGGVAPSTGQPTGPPAGPSTAPSTGEPAGQHADRTEDR